MRATVTILLVLLMMVRSPAVTFALPVAQEPEPTTEPTVEVTPEPAPYRFDEIDGQDVRYDYVISAGDVMVAGLMLTLLVSVWALGGLFVLSGGRRQ